MIKFVTAPHKFDGNNEITRGFFSKRNQRPFDWLRLSTMSLETWQVIGQSVTYFYAL
jgi:hypothetical protein